MAYHWLPVNVVASLCLSGVWVTPSQSHSVSEFVDVIGESVEGIGGLVGVGTVVSALAGLDHHDVLVEGLTVLTAELDTDGSGVMGTAAASIHTGPAVLGPVLLQAGAASIGELHWLAGLLGSAALLSFL